MLDALALALPPRVYERLGAALILRFTNAVGWFNTPHLGRLEVRSRKWGEEHFDAMLSEISGRMAALPFSAGTGGHLPYDRHLAQNDRVLLHTFVYLRYICSVTAAPRDQVVPALRLVTSQPHRRLERTSRWAPLNAARRIDERGLARMLTPRAGLQRAGGAEGLPLAKALRGHLPENVEESRVTHSVDVPENRFVKTFLDQMLGIVERVRAVAQRQRGNFLRRRLLCECEDIERLIAPARRHPIWNEVGPMHRLPAESTVLQRRRGYRDLFRQYLRLRMTARIPLTPDELERLLEIKDIATLYEIWTFFAIEQSVTKALGRHPTSADQASLNDLRLSLPHDLRVAWGDVELFYNLRFSRSRPQRRSYSIPLRPDVVLRVPHGPNRGVHVFDAKFRLDKINRIARDTSEVDDVDERDEQRGKFKNADLYKMHTYRDALPEARSVWIVYPGTEFGFFTAGADPRLVKRVESLESRLDGVGGVPAKPASKSDELELLIFKLLSTATQP